MRPVRACAIVAILMTTVTLPHPAAASILKPGVSGVFSRDGAPPPDYLSVMGGWVVNAYWKDLQPNPGDPIVTNPKNAIDQAIDQVHKINAANPAYKLRLKVRLFAGVDAPDWAKSLGGGPVTISDPGSGITGTVGRFWTKAFGTAYTDFINKIAALYDSVYAIGDVTLNRCMTIYAEPYIRQTSVPSNVSHLLAAGFTTDKDTTCHQEEIDNGRAFSTTRVSVAFNPYQQINADGTTQTNEALTEQMIDYCRRQLLKQCVLENNSIRTPELGGDYPALYAKIQRMGPPIAFQTATLARVGDLGATLQWAVGEGANVVEWPGSGLTPSQLAPYNNALKANPQ